MAMSRFETEERPVKPDEFDEWLDELGLLADCEGAWALIGAWMYSPTECTRYLVTLPGLWEGLIARGRYADLRRFDLGMRVGRRMGV